MLTLGCSADEEEEEEAIILNIVLFEIGGERKLTVVTRMVVGVQFVCLLAGMVTLCYREKRQHYFDMCRVMRSLLEAQVIVTALTHSHL
jgi:hypothetical protein